MVSFSHIPQLVIIATTSIFLASCGLYVPDKSPVMAGAADLSTKSKTSRQAEYENKLIEHINCELVKGLVKSKHWSLPWLTAGNFGTAVTLTITAEQQSGVSLGASILSPFRNNIRMFPTAQGGNVVSPQSFTFGIGATGAANATRTETIQYTLKNSDLVAFDSNLKRGCFPYQDGIMMDGDLKIGDFIYDNAELASLNNLNSATSVPPKIVRQYGSVQDIPVFNTLTEEINFVGAFGGSLNPTWKLVPLTINTPNNLLGVENTYTNDLIITIGRLASEKIPYQLDSAATAQHQSRVNANAISTSISSQAH